MMQKELLILIVFDFDVLKPYDNCGLKSVVSMCKEVAYDKIVLCKSALRCKGWFSLATEAEEKGNVSFFFFFCLCRAVFTSAQGSLLLLFLLP